jgi:hypothetical protein
MITWHKAARPLQGQPTAASTATHRGPSPFLQAVWHNVVGLGETLCPPTAEVGHGRGERASA